MVGTAAPLALRGLSPPYIPLSRGMTAGFGHSRVIATGTREQWRHGVCVFFFL